MNVQLTGLFDYDSLIYMSVYKIVDFKQLRQWYRLGKTREWIEAEIVQYASARLFTKGYRIFEYLEERGIEIIECHYYITAAKNSRRKKTIKSYKANRKKNKWVQKVRQFLLDTAFAHTSDEWEADDLIKDKADELGRGEYIIITVDKDLKQIPGFYFDYYDVKKVDPMTKERVSQGMRGLSAVDPEEAKRFFWESMLIGDSGDNIQGIKGIGPKRAKKILDPHDVDALNTVVRRVYEEEYGKEAGEIKYKEAYFLLKLGVKNRDEWLEDKQ